MTALDLGEAAPAFVICGVLFAVVLGAFTWTHVWLSYLRLRAHGCTSRSTAHGQGRDWRPEAMLCHRRPGHWGGHVGFDPDDGRVWQW